MHQSRNLLPKPGALKGLLNSPWAGRSSILNARRRAEALLRENGIDRLPVDPFAIANDRDIIVEAKPDAEPSISGMLSATNRLRRKILHLAFVARFSRVRG